MIFYGLLCAAGVGLAAHGGSRPLLIVSLIFASGWLLYAANWNEWSFREMLHRANLDYPEWQLWQFTDGLQALAILYIGGKRWWSLGLVSLFCVQEIAHDLYGRFGLYDWAGYTGLLNSLFLMQIALLLIATLTEGGDVLRFGHRRVRNLRGSRAVFQA